LSRRLWLNTCHSSIMAGRASTGAWAQVCHRKVAGLRSHTAQFLKDHLVSTPWRHPPSGCILSTGICCRHCWGRRASHSTASCLPRAWGDGQSAACHAAASAGSRQWTLCDKGNPRCVSRGVVPFWSGRFLTRHRRQRSTTADANRGRAACRWQWKRHLRSSTGIQWWASLWQASPIVHM